MLEQLRQALRADGIDRTDDDALAVGVDEVRVLPGTRDLSQAGRVHLAGRQHDLLAASLEVIAVDVDVGELVVLANALQLVIGRQQRPPVGDPNIRQRRLIAREHARVQRPVAGQIAHVDPVQGHCTARGDDVVVDIWTFGAELVWTDGDLLVEPRPDFAEKEADDNPQDGHGGRGQQEPGGRAG